MEHAIPARTRVHILSELRGVALKKNEKEAEVHGNRYLGGWVFNIYISYEIIYNILYIIYNVFTTCICIHCPI